MHHSHSFVRYRMRHCVDLRIMVIWLILYNSGLRITEIFSGAPWRCYIVTRL